MTQLRASGPNPVRIRPVRPSAALTAWYEIELDKLIAPMCEDVAKALLPIWHSAPKPTLFMTFPHGEVKYELAEIEAKWHRVFAEKASAIALGMTKRVLEYWDTSFADALTKAGIGIPKPAMDGDVDGHSFHGNRWTGGIGGEFKAVNLQSKEFKDWFAGSKIVDSTGAPLKVFHGTGTAFSEFNVPENGGTAYFTPDQEYKYVKEAAVVIPCYLRLENPLFTDRLSMVERLNIDPEWVEEIKAQGYDGVVYAKQSDITKGPTGWGDDRPQIIAFSREQIKSAENNSGAFGKHGNIYDASPSSASHFNPAKLSGTVEMPIAQFLELALPTETPGGVPEKLGRVRATLARGDKFAHVPHLTIVAGKVVGHEGRHRAMVLREMGYSTIPVLLKGAPAGAFTLESQDGKHTAMLGMDAKKDFRKEFRVKFDFTERLRATAQAHIDENVALIHSIPDQFHHRIKRMAWKSIESGRDIAGFTKDLQDEFDITLRRAALIARDQNNKMTAMFSRTRRLDLGLTTAIWRHTSSLHPREEHIDFDGESYSIEEGMYSEEAGENIWPGTEICCGCVDETEIPGYEEN